MRALLAMAASILGIAVFCGACGGGGGGGNSQADVENAIRGRLLGSVFLNLGLNKDGMIVAANESAAKYFSNQPTIPYTVDDLQIRNAAVDSDGDASADVTFRLRAYGGPVECDGRVVVSKDEGIWQVMSLAVASCQ